MTREIDEMTVWLVSGEASTESGTGGVEQWLYTTADAMTLPDVRRRFYYENSKNGRDWYRIESIRLIEAPEMQRLLNDGVGLVSFVEGL